MGHGLSMFVSAVHLALLLSHAFTSQGLLKDKGWSQLPTIAGPLLPLFPWFC